MFSVLIPTYNYDITPLVMEIKNQCKTNKIEFEILAFDDGSNSSLNEVNTTINTLENCYFKVLPKNIGRSAIRNLLGKTAKYENLLFIDAGTTIENSEFIKNYMEHIDIDVLNGGMIAKKQAPKKPFKLRWLYTKNREHKALCSSNFLIKKDIFFKFLFNESVKKYGFEDVLFFDQLISNGIEVKVIQNPVLHNSDDDANTYLTKTKAGLENLTNLIENGLLKPNSSKIYQHYLKLEKYRLSKLTSKIHKWFIKIFLLNFNSSNPSLLLFDIYRLSYLCYIKTKD